MGSETWMIRPPGLAIQTWVAFLVMGTALFYVLGAADLTARIRGWLPGPLLRLIECPACSGFWIGLLFHGLDLGPFGGPSLSGWILDGAVGLVGIPIVFGLMRQGLEWGRS